MKFTLIGLLGAMAVWAGPGTTNPKPNSAAAVAAAEAVQRGLRWLVSTQGRDGGWGQDGGETSFVRTGERLEHSGNDVANTAVAVLALLRTGHSPEQGQYAASARRGVEFILASIEQSPAAGLAVTNARDTQIQRKLGPYIDTFVSSMLLSELDGRVRDPKLAARVHAALRKCVTKIEQNQQQDGSWNSSGGWAPVLGTSMASRSLNKAKDRGIAVDEKVMARVDKYTRDNLAYSAARPAAGASGKPTGAAPPVALYQGAQALEQLTRSEVARKANATEIRLMTAQLSDAQYVRGFGSMGGEEFFSYLNISESMKRAGGQAWQEWNQKIKAQLVDLQNQDGTWAGHHCITGRVAVTGAAILTLTVDRQL